MLQKIRLSVSFIVFVCFLARTSYAANGWPPLTPFMPQDQIQFEADVNDMESIAQEITRGVNQYRAAVLQKEYDLKFAVVYSPRKVSGWLCRYWETFPIGNTFGPEYRDFFAVGCAGEARQYTLLLRAGDTAVHMMEQMTDGKPIKFDGSFYHDVAKIHYLRLNEPTLFLPVIIVDLPN